MAQTFRHTLFKSARDHLRLRAKVTGVSPSIALLHEIADHFGYQYEALSHLRQISLRRVPSVSKSVSYLKRQGYVRARRIGDRLEVCLTADGHARVLRDRLRAIKIRLNNGEIWIVIFDFPESERARRDQWRHFLKWLGMKYMQKSVWYTDRDIGREIAEMVRRGGLGEWIQVLKAQKITS